MTIGEFDYDTLFRQSPGGADENDETEEIPFPEASFFLWIIFVIIMPILLSNLLVSFLITCTMMCTGAHIKDLQNLPALVSYFVLIHSNTLFSSRALSLLYMYAFY